MSLQQTLIWVMVERTYSNSLQLALHITTENLLFWEDLSDLASVSLEQITVWLQSEQKSTQIYFCPWRSISWKCINVLNGKVQNVLNQKSSMKTGFFCHIIPGLVDEHKWQLKWWPLLILTNIFQWMYFPLCPFLYSHYGSWGCGESNSYQQKKVLPCDLVRLSHSQ